MDDPMNDDPGAFGLEQDSPITDTQTVAGDVFHEPFDVTRQVLG